MVSDVSDLKSGGEKKGELNSGALTICCIERMLSPLRVQVSGSRLTHRDGYCLVPTVISHLHLIEHNQQIQSRKLKEAYAHLRVYVLNVFIVKDIEI